VRTVFQGSEFSAPFPTSMIDGSRRRWKGGAGEHRTGEDRPRFPASLGGELREGDGRRGAIREQATGGQGRAQADRREAEGRDLPFAWQVTLRGPLLLRREGPRARARAPSAGDAEKRRGPLPEALRNIGSFFAQSRGAARRKPLPGRMDRGTSGGPSPARAPVVSRRSDARDRQREREEDLLLCGNVVEIDEAEKIARLYVFADEGRKRLKETARILSDRHGCRVEKIVDVLEYAPEIKECGIEIFMQGETADLREKAYGMFLRFQGVPKMFFHLYSFETNVETDSEDIEISNIDINNFLEVVYFYVDFFRTLLKDITVCRKFKNHFNSLCRNPNFDLYEMYMNRDELLEFFSMPEISLDASYGYSERRLNRCCSRVRKLARDFARLLETVGDFLPEVYVVGVPSGRRGSPPLVRFVFEMGESDEEDARAGGSKRTVSFVWATAIGVDGCSMAFLSHADDFEIVTHLLLSFGMYDELVSSFREHFVAVSRSSFRVVSSARGGLA